MYISSSIIFNSVPLYMGWIRNIQPLPHVLTLCHCVKGYLGFNTNMSNITFLVISSYLHLLLRKSYLTLSHLRCPLLCTLTWRLYTVLGLHYHGPYDDTIFIYQWHYRVFYTFFRFLGICKNLWCYSKHSLVIKLLTNSYSIPTLHLKSMINMTVLQSKLRGPWSDRTTAVFPCLQNTSPTPRAPVLVPGVIPSGVYLYSLFRMTFISRLYLFFSAFEQNVISFLPPLTLADLVHLDPAGGVFQLIPQWMAIASGFTHRPDPRDPDLNWYDPL